MAKINALASFIALIQGDRIATLSTATEAFTADFGHYARSNNREPLNVAVAALKKAPKDKAIGEAISAGYLASGLAVGYIGAQSGKFAVQPDEIRATYEAAITAAGEAFRACLEASEAFAEKAVKTAEEKAAAKAEKEAKAFEASNALITAKIQTGELVRASDVKALKDMSAFALVEALIAANAIEPLTGFALDGIKALSGLAVQVTALQAELAALQAVKSAKPAKTVRTGTLADLRKAA